VRIGRGNGANVVATSSSFIHHWMLARTSVSLPIIQIAITPSGAVIVILSPSKVVGAGSIFTLGPNMAVLWVWVCLGVHGMEPMVGGDEFDSRVRVMAIVLQIIMSFS
jgi:hypothetical protein